jgi:A/G-specific adenine glycosylase
LTQLFIPYDAHTVLSKLDKQLFADWLIAWYKANKRDLPWRNTDDAYKIWLSEIILQQTRVAQGLSYYQRFIEQYPTVYDLANANEEAVLRLWQGLGYYSRARNMHACAKMIVEQFQGQLPSSYQELLQLKGIGHYTAAAIASIAFKESVPVVDGNVYRVLARVFGVTEDIASNQGKKVFRELAQSLIPDHAADDYNQAIMDFGAIQCTPQKPLCTTCIFKSHCIAFQTHKQRDLPVKKSKAQVKQRFLHYLVIQTTDHVYMRLRKGADIWQGLYDFYLIEDSQLKEIELLEDELVALIKRHQLHVVKDKKAYRHILTHRRLHAYFFHVYANPRFIKEAKPLLDQTHSQAFSLEATKSLPKPILISNFLEKELYSSTKDEKFHY